MRLYDAKYRRIKIMDPQFDRCDGAFTYYVIIFLKSQTEFCDRRSPQLVVAVGHNIFEVTVTHIRGQRLSQFLVPAGHKIL